MVIGPVTVVVFKSELLARARTVVAVFDPRVLTQPANSRELDS